MLHFFYVIGSEATEKLAMLMNKTFDVLNGRKYAEGITNNVNYNDKNKRTVKEMKWETLNAMLSVLDITEVEHESRQKNSNSPSEMFCSLTTLKALHMTINSAMALSEELLQNNYHTVLTGKMNQDPIEVLLHNPYIFIRKVFNLHDISFYYFQRFFGIARSIDNTPSAHSWLHIFRILFMHNLTKTAVKNGNVDDEDELKVLVGYKKCLVDRFKAIEAERKQAKLSLKDKLLSELSIRYVDHIEN